MVRVRSIGVFVQLPVRIGVHWYLPGTRGTTVVCLVRVYQVPGTRYAHTFLPLPGRQGVDAWLRQREPSAPPPPRGGTPSVRSATKAIDNRGVVVGWSKRVCLPLPCLAFPYLTLPSPLRCLAICVATSNHDC